MAAPPSPVLELRVPQDHTGRFSTECSKRLGGHPSGDVCAGVSTRKVRAIMAELCGHASWASSSVAINKRLDESLKTFAERPLRGPFADFDEQSVTYP
ncbi:hypothetical protein CK231_22485 [Mesorhizobium loti]|uniref:transposase n=1 Tax=Rhizobium loti TaxID=381 RepID=UPI000BAEA25A|nr:hypothetical protein CK231_22485 [Mesorhizobium loti]PBC07450.1 hypothetical protein CK230_25950 [Mesorhizobium sp. WSM3859]